MAFTNGEAHAVNRLLDFFLGKDPASLTSMAMAPTAEEAKQAAALLANRAGRTLGAGWNENAVNRVWTTRYDRDLLRAVEGLLAELGASEPGAVKRNGDVEYPANVILDHLFEVWNATMCALHSDHFAMFEPNGYDETTLAALRGREKP